VRFTIENNAQTYTAKIIATENSIAEATRSLKVKAIVENSNPLMIAGGFIKVQITLGKNNAALMIPTQAIIPQARGKQVVAIRNGLASIEKVGTGFRDATRVEITSGLNAGDTDLITGLLSAKQGSKVTFDKIIKN
jgi:membrane fusion protein (multidrug efflux system)